MTFTEIEAILIAATPTITAVIGIISAYFKIKGTSSKSTKQLINEFESVKKTVEDTEEYDALKDELALVHQENIELKKTIKELLVKIDRIARDKKEE